MRAYTMNYIYLNNYRFIKAMGEIGRPCKGKTALLNHSVPRIDFNPQGWKTLTKNNLKDSLTKASAFLL